MNHTTPGRTAAGIAPTQLTKASLTAAIGSGHAIIDIDLDGVCANYSDGLWRMIAAQHHLDPTQPVAPDNYDLAKATGWPFSTGEDFRTANADATRAGLYRNLSPMPGTKVGFDYLDQAGFHIRIATHRLFVSGMHQQVVTDTAHWLDVHELPYRSLCFVDTKETLRANLHIEDDPHLVDRLIEAGEHVIVFDQPYNRNVVGTARVASWADLTALLDTHLQPQAPNPLELIIRPHGDGFVIAEADDGIRVSFTPRSFTEATPGTIWGINSLSDDRVILDPQGAGRQIYLLAARLFPHHRWTDATGRAAETAATRLRRYLHYIDPYTWQWHGCPACRAHALDWKNATPEQLQIEHAPAGTYPLASHTITIDSHTTNHLKTIPGIDHDTLTCLIESDKAPIPLTPHHGPDLVACPFNAKNESTEHA